MSSRYVEPGWFTTNVFNRIVPLLREYVRRWKIEIGTFFLGVGPDASEEDIRRIAPDYPVFRILPAG